MGAWISYALGSLSDNLPAFVVLPDNRGLPYNNAGNFSAAFLPAAHQGVIIKPNSPIPIANLQPPKFATHVTADSESDGLKLLDQLNRDHLAQRPGDSRLEARIASYELAAKMQTSAPRRSISRARRRRRKSCTASTTKSPLRSAKTVSPLGECSNAACDSCRFGAAWAARAKTGTTTPTFPNELPFIARTVDKPIAGLLRDLKQRGMFDDTLVVWTTEFGRMPFTQGATGRDHNGGTFVTWLAGAGIKPGVTYGQSDEFGYQAAEGKTYCYDLHATILHLLGIDHKRLTFRHNGIDRRLTDVHGHVVPEILA